MLVRRCRRRQHHSLPSSNPMDTITLIGALLTSFIIDSIGRRPAVITSSVLMVSGWISFSLASSLSILLVAKIFQGMSIGLGTTMGGVLIAEYSSPKYRGSFTATIQTAMLSGSLIAHSFGLFYNWHQISTILVFFALLGLLFFHLNPQVSWQLKDVMMIAEKFFAG